MADVPRDPAALPVLSVPKNFYIVAVPDLPHTVPCGAARSLRVAAVSTGGSVTLTRVGGASVVFDEAMLRAHLTADNDTAFACALEYEFEAFAATNCTGFLVSV